MLIGVKGMGPESFLAEHRKSIEEYIMAGYGDGWKHCDILSANAVEAGFNEDIPHFAITLDKVLTIDLASIVSSSQCLMAVYGVDTLQNLATIIKFGWKAIKYKRIALILKMGSGMTIDNAMNRTKLPFLVAAQMEHGERQFICPFIGEDEPILQEQMCKKSYVSMKRKSLRIGMVGNELYGKKILDECKAQIFIYVAFEPFFLQLQKMVWTVQMFGY